MGKSMVHGVGINDADYLVRPKTDGYRPMCKIYLAWSSMLQRCYCKKYQLIKPTYVGCTVEDSWLLFSNFSHWLLQFKWQGMVVDKDIIFLGNKHYSPDNCAIVTPLTNTFITDSLVNRGDWPSGVSFNKRDRIFESYCRNPFARKKESLGRFSDPFEAHQAWKNRKHELACQLADMQSDPRVAAALRLRYAP